MPRVLHLSEYVQGGVATYLKALLHEQLRDEKWSDFRVLASAQHSKYLAPLPSEVVMTYEYPRRSVRNLQAFAAAARAAIDAFQPDILHLHSTFPGFIGRVPGLGRSMLFGDACAKVVYTPNGWSFRMDTATWKRQLYAFVERLLVLRSDCLLCVSNDELAGAREIGAPAEKCRLVFNALPVEAPAPEPVDLPHEVLAAKDRGEIVLLFMGRYDHQKGLDLLLPAMQEVMQRPIWLICVGGKVVGESRFQFSGKSFDRGWATPGQITWLLEFCDAMIAPSRWEGLPLSAIEATRAGRAIISSRAGGFTDIVHDQVNGILLRDLSTACIVDTLKSINKEQLRDFGQAGREIFLKDFTSPVMYARTRDIYEELLAQR